MLHYYELYMHHNFCFRRKQHSYAACDAALAASKDYNELNKRHTGFYLRTQSLMPVLDNPQLEINHLQNYKVLWRVFKY